MPATFGPLNRLMSRSSVRPEARTSPRTLSPPYAEQWCPPRSIAPLHSLVELSAIIEVHASECGATLGQKPGPEISHGTLCGLEIVPQGALDQAGQRLAVPGGSRLCFTNQAVIKVQGRLHTETSTPAAVRVNSPVDTAGISKSRGTPGGERIHHTTQRLASTSFTRPAPWSGSLSRRPPSPSAACGQPSGLRLRASSPTAAPTTSTTPDSALPERNPLRKRYVYLEDGAIHADHDRGQPACPLFSRTTGHICSRTRGSSRA